MCSTPMTSGRSPQQVSGNSFTTTLAVSLATKDRQGMADEAASDLDGAHGGQAQDAVELLLELLRSSVHRPSLRLREEA